MIFIYVVNGPERENKPYPVKRQLIRLYLPFIQYISRYLLNSVCVYTHIEDNIYFYK